MPDVLLLRLEGPLQSWGVRSRWDVRDTRTEPTKSGVLGLIGCALGYPVGDPRLATLNAGLQFGVRVEAPGRIREDFQTVTGHLPTASGGFRHRDGTSSRSFDPVRDAHLLPATIISPRFYIEDGAFLAGVVGDSELLARCAAALQNPVWPIFLGRKCCVPSRPVFESLSDQYKDLEDALRRYPWSWLGGLGIERTAPQSVSVYLEDADGTDTVQDVFQVNAARVYGFRQVRRLERLPVPSDLLPEGGTS